MKEWIEKKLEEYKDDPEFRSEELFLYFEEWLAVAKKAMEVYINNNENRQ